MEAIYEIPGDPVPWAAHRGMGRRSYNPRHAEKKVAQWHLSLQHGKRPLYSKAVRIDFFFEVRMPASLPKRIRREVERGEKVHCTKRPDRTNYIKYIEDCLTGVVLADDNIVVAGDAYKYYSRDPRTIIIIAEIKNAT